MANAETDQSVYYVPHNGWYPVVLAAGLAVMLTGFATWLNETKAGEAGSWVQTLIGFAVVAVVLYMWFGKVIAENQQGLANEQLKRSYVWSMGWFIFSEVMFFAAFFGALFYARTIAVAWLGGEGAKALTGDYLWPDQPRCRVVPGSGTDLGGTWQCVWMAELSTVLQHRHTADIQLDYSRCPRRN